MFFEYLQGGRIHCLSGQPVPVVSHPYRATVQQCFLFLVESKNMHVFEYRFDQKISLLRQSKAMQQEICSSAERWIVYFLTRKSFSALISNLLNIMKLGKQSKIGENMSEAKLTCKF